MLSVNQKSFDIIELLLSKNQKDLSFKDTYGFDIFTYIIRNNSIHLFFYFLKNYFDKLKLNFRPCEKYEEFSLLYLFDKSPFNFLNKTEKGCAFIHWAAYQNSVFFIKICFRLNLNLMLPDSSGKTPMNRASENNAMRVINFYNNHSYYPF